MGVADRDMSDTSSIGNLATVSSTQETLGAVQELIAHARIPIIHNKLMHIETPLEAWLTFLSNDEPNRIIELITQFPEFKPMYETLYQMCQNIERVMDMFSEELRILDKNTVKYMIEEQQQEIDKQREMLEEKDTKKEEFILMFL